MRVWQETEVGFEYECLIGPPHRHVRHTVQAFWRPIQGPPEFEEIPGDKAHKTRYVIPQNGKARTITLTGKPW